MKVFCARVVGAGRADHRQRCQPLRPEICLQLTYRVHLTRDPDDRETGQSARKRRLHQRDQRGVAHTHAPALVQRRGVRHDGRHRSPAIGRVPGHGQHGIDFAPLQQPRRQLGGDAGPLRALERRFEPCLPHGVMHAKKAFVAARFAYPPVHTPFDTGIVRAHKLAGPTAARRFGGARYTAICAQRTWRYRIRERHWRNAGRWG